MYNIKDLVGEFAWVDVITVCMVGDEGNVQRADMRDVGQALEEVMLVLGQYGF